MRPRVLAIAAHPDDIEFGMGGTLLLLGQAGCEIHYLNIADGSGGSAVHDGPTTAAPAQVLADVIGRVLRAPPGRVWVRVQVLPRSSENTAVFL